MQLRFYVDNKQRTNGYDAKLQNVFRLFQRDNIGFGNKNYKTDIGGTALQVKIDEKRSKFSMQQADFNED